MAQKTFAVIAKKPGEPFSMCFLTSPWRWDTLFIARSLKTLGVPCWLEGIDYDGEIPMPIRAQRPYLPEGDRHDQG